MSDELEALAMRAYKKYCEATRGKSLVTGDVLPSWEILPGEIKHAWRAAAEGVVQGVIETLQGLE